MQDAFTIYHQVHQQQSHSPDSAFLESLGHAVAGATGTAVSNLIVYPLDLVVTRLQVQQKRGDSSGDADEQLKYAGVQEAVDKIYRNEGGFGAFYVGIAQDTLKSVADSFLFFLFYNALLRASRRRLGAMPKTLPIRLLDEVGIGMLAGAGTRAITSPIQQVITQKQTSALMTNSPYSKGESGTVSRPQSTTHILRQIYRTQGLQGFWAGYSASIILTLNPSLTMSIDSLLQRLVSSSKQTGSLLTFLLAAIAKATASSLTYPVALAKTRAQASTTVASLNADQGRRTPGGVLTMIPYIARHHGISALYAGLSGEVVKGFFSHGLTMLVKHRIHATVIQLYFVIVKRLQRRKLRV